MGRSSGYGIDRPSCPSSSNGQVSGDEQPIVTLARNWTSRRSMSRNGAASMHLAFRRDSRSIAGTSLSSTRPAFRSSAAYRAIPTSIASSFCLGPRQSSGHSS